MDLRSTGRDSYTVWHLARGPSSHEGRAGMAPRPWAHQGLGCHTTQEQPPEAHQPGALTSEADSALQTRMTEQSPFHGVTSPTRRPQAFRTREGAGGAPPGTLPSILRGICAFQTLGSARLKLLISEGHLLTGDTAVDGSQAL